jgi:hypothetical protein
MRNRLFAIGRQSPRERREIFFAVEALPVNPPDPQKVERQIDEDTKYLDTSFKDMLSDVEKTNGIAFSPDRMEGIERQRSLIRQKLSAIKGMKFEYEQEYNFQRDKLVNQVWDLLSYAKFQAEQQKDLEKKPAEPLDVEQDEKDGILRLWVPDDGTSSMELAFAQNNPQVAKLVGTIRYEQNTVSSRMDGTFSLVRMESGGKKYWVVSIEPKFNGTFTFLSGGKRKTVDVASIGDQRDFKKVQREGKVLEEQRAKMEVLQKEIMADTLSPELKYLAYEVKAIMAELEELQAKLQQYFKNPKGLEKEIADTSALSESRMARMQELQKKYETIKQNRMRWAKEGFSRPDLTSEIPSERERTIYQILKQMTPDTGNGFPTWIEAEQINKLAKEMFLPLDPPVKNGMEDYMIQADGTLLMRTRRRARAEVKGGPVVPGRIVAQFAYQGGEWVEAKPEGKRK